MSKQHPASFEEIAFQLLGGKYPDLSPNGLARAAAKAEREHAFARLQTVATDMLPDPHAYRQRIHKLSEGDAYTFVIACAFVYRIIVKTAADTNDALEIAERLEPYPSQIRTVLFHIEVLGLSPSEILKHLRELDPLSEQPPL